DARVRCWDTRGEAGQNSEDLLELKRESCHGAGGCVRPLDGPVGSPDRAVRCPADCRPRPGADIVDAYGTGRTPTDGRRSGARRFAACRLGSVTWMTVAARPQQTSRHRPPALPASAA